MRIAVDAMGGDHAPDEIVKGVLEARKCLDKEDELVLIGVKEKIEPHLPSKWRFPSGLSVVDAPEIIGMDEAPVEALRKKKKSSIALMAKMAASGEFDTIISAGNTGACVAACQLRMRNLEGVNRPGIAVTLPTFGGPVTVCDVGANVACKPINLYQYAVMSSVYARRMLGIENPRVALMGIGAEAGKGNTLVKRTRELLDADENINFIGNIEGRDIFDGTCDVAICEGFVGNVVLKLTEGLVDGLFRAIKQELLDEGLRLAMKFKPVMMRIYQKYDYHEYGGALLLGVNGNSIICHGTSKSRTIKNAIMASKKFVNMEINEAIVEYLSTSTVRPNSE
ncbi:Phosphate acyltransferase [Anaerohalosphaera lusitana]|uniref:Phosphate acyltransferase n=1 Tax=Anaerohalosphaera lusitana TaxID=1936003 RepID=A0A1U9NMM8_9BACT|nr:phosphate acyltransferase PlsX [Anaerohalosphaera lusitana]AQT69159.1 Phosphate acyltransferase [Anaerohalosphaera lusitana]